MDLEAKAPVTIHLHEKTAPGPNPGDQITLKVDSSKKELTVEAKNNNTFEKIQNDNVKFKLETTTTKPARGVHSVEFTEVGQSPVKRLLEKNGRHVIVLIPE